MELIDKQEAIDTILGQPPELHYPSWYADQIRSLPSAQPEIIRCKDCQYWDTSWQNDYAPDYHYCPMIDETRRSDFYCADAERKVTE